MSWRPLAGGFRLLCETGAAIGAAPGPPLPSAPSGTLAAILKKCDARGQSLGVACRQHPMVGVGQAGVGLQVGLWEGQPESGPSISIPILVCRGGCL
jgi:hypothetical protein